MEKKMDKSSDKLNQANFDKRTAHPYGIIWEASECNILESKSNGSLLIAPFHDYRYTYNILIWDPNSLRILNRFPADRIWKLWDNYYVTFQKDMKYVDNILLHTLTSKGMKKIKNIHLNTEYTFTDVKRIVGSKRFKAAYVMEDYWVGIIHLNSEERFEWTSEEEILQAFVCDDLKLMVVCTEAKVMLYSLDDMGVMQEDPCYEVQLENEFGSAYLDNNNELTIVTTKKKEEEDILNVFVSKFKLGETEYEEIQKETPLFFLTFTEYDFEFLAGNKMIVCISDHEPLTIVSAETGEVLYKNQIIGKLFKIDFKKGSMFLSNYTALQKLELNIFQENKCES